MLQHEITTQLLISSNTQPHSLMRSCLYLPQHEAMLKIRKPHIARQLATSSLITKLPLVLFEAYELICDYSNNLRPKPNKRDLTIVAALVLCYLFIAYKRYREHSKLFYKIKTLANTTNNKLKPLLANTDHSLRQRICQQIDNITQSAPTSIQHCHIIAINPRLNLIDAISKGPKRYSVLPPCCSIKNMRPTYLKIPASINSHRCMEAIENFELWLGIAWLAYCFVDNYRDDKLPTEYLAIIIGCGIGYTILQLSYYKPHQLQEEYYSLTKFSLGVAAVFNQYAVEASKKTRRGSLPGIFSQSLTQQSAPALPERRHSW